MWVLQEVDVLDIASTSGLSGQNTTPAAGVAVGTSLPVQVASNIEFNIARRYRGGKPRMYLPPGTQADLQNEASYTPAYLQTLQQNVTAFFTDLNNMAQGAVGPFKHVNLSYYSGVWTTEPEWPGPGHVYPPKYRSQALSDEISGYSPKALLSSQKRRRTSTTP